MSFTENLKESFNNNKFVKFLTVGGAVASVVNLFTVSAPGIVAVAGQWAGAYAINQALKGNESLSIKSDGDLNAHLIKSAFLIVGATAVGIVANGIIPSIMPQITGTVVAAGVIGLGDSAIEKFKRKKPKM